MDWTTSNDLCSRFAFCWFCCVLYWLISPYSRGLLLWTCCNQVIAPVLTKQPWRIWVNKSHLQHLINLERYHTNHELMVKLQRNEHNNIVSILCGIYCISRYIDGLGQDCSNSSALDMGLLQSYPKPSIYRGESMSYVCTDRAPLFLIFLCGYL